MTKHLIKNDFLIRCSLLVIWFLKSFHLEITIFYIFKIFDILLNFKHLDPFVFLFILRFFSVFFEFKSDGQKKLNQKFIYNNYFIILIIRLFLNHSRKNITCITIFYEESVYFLDYFYHKETNIYKITELYKKILDINQNTNEKTNLTLLNFNYNFILLTRQVSIVQTNNLNIYSNKKDFFYRGYGIKSYLDNIIINLSNYFSRFSKISEIIILKILFKLDSKLYPDKESRCLLLLYFYFLSIENNIKTFILLFLIELEKFLPLFFLKKIINIGELFKFENHIILKTSFTLYYYFSNNCYFKYYDTPKILFIKCKKTCVQKYLKKFLSLMFTKDNTNSNSNKLWQVYGFYFNSYISEIEFETFMIFFLRQSFLLFGSKFLIITIKHLVDNLKCKKIWKKIIRALYDIIFSVYNSDCLQKLLHFLQKNVKDFPTYNEFFKLLLKIKIKNVHNQIYFERVLLEIYIKLKNINF